MIRGSIDHQIFRAAGISKIFGPNEPAHAPASRHARKRGGPKIGLMVRLLVLYDSPRYEVTGV